MRAGRKANLIVHNKVDAPTRIIAANAREAEAFPNNPLPGKGGVAMQQHWQDLRMLALANIIAECLVGANLPKHNRVNRLKVRRVGHKAHMHLDAVKFPIRRGAKVIFHIARTANIIRVRRPSRKLMENDAIWLCHHIGEHVEAATMRHANHNLAHALRTAMFDKAL